MCLSHPSGVWQPAPVTEHEQTYYVSPGAHPAEVREQAAVAVLSTLRPRARRAEVMAYCPDDLGPLPARAATAVERITGGRPGIRASRRTGNLDLSDPVAWATVEALAAWSAYTQLQDADGEDLAGFDNGWPFGLSLTPAEASRVRDTLPSEAVLLSPEEALVQVQDQMRKAKADMRSAFGQLLRRN